TPLTLFKAALAFHRASDRGNAEAAWKLLTAKAARELRLGNKVVTVSQLEEFRDQWKPAGQLSEYDWRSFRGNPSRVAQGVGSGPHLDPRWKQPTIITDSKAAPQQTQNYLYGQNTGAVKWLESRNQAVLPAFHPVAVTVRMTRKGQELTVPLMVYRS